MTKNDTQKEAIEFILDYQAGKYGHMVRGECKALMYAQALMAETHKELHNVHYGFEKILGWVGKFNDEKPIGNNAWISQEGYIFYCSFGNHRQVAEWCFLTLEKEFEKTHAKVRHDTYTHSDAIRYMEEEPTDLMKRAMNVMGLKRR